MKPGLLISIGLIALSNSVFCQCPQPGLKIVSADCEPPKNPGVSVVSCSILEVKWLGNKNQTYVVKASYTDAGANSIEIEGTKISCDKNGNCTASVPVKESTTVNWSVQAVCSADGVILYSSLVNGPDAYTPSCSEKRADVVKENAVHVYPNPATNYLLVEFEGRVTGTIEFKVFDITGKNVYDKFADAVIRTNNQYKLDLRHLPAATYLLELHNNNLLSQTKFVLMRN